MTVISAITLIIGCIAAQYSWRQSTDRWRISSGQPEGDPVVRMVGFGYVRVEEGTPVAAIRRRIDTISTKGIPGEDRLLDCAVEWVDTETEWAKTGCNNIAPPVSMQVGYIYQWPSSKKAPSVVWSRLLVAEAEEKGTLPAPTKRTVTSERALGRWPPHSPKPDIYVLLTPAVISVAIAALPWVAYAVSIWVLLGFSSGSREDEGIQSGPAG